MKTARSLTYRCAARQASILAVARCLSSLTFMFFLVGCGKVDRDNPAATALIRSDTPGGVSWVGFRGDGSSAFPNSQVPSSWDERTGSNILWKTPVANWGYACPVVVSNTAVVLSEPGWTNDWPVLEAFDVRDGTRLWTRELCYLDGVAMSGAEKAAVRERWTAWLRGFRAAYKEMYLRRQGGQVAAAHQNPMALFAKCDFRTWTDCGLPEEQWHFSLRNPQGLYCIGLAFSTPVSDGESLYVVTPFDGGCVFALDLMGNRVWMARGSATKPPPCDARARSPLVYGDLLITDIGQPRAYDRRTGRLRWNLPLRDPMEARSTITSPVVMTVGGKDYLLYAVYFTDRLKGKIGLRAVDLPEGKETSIVGWMNSGTMMLTKYDEPDVVFFTGSGEHSNWENEGRGPGYKPPAAVRFSRKDGGLEAQVLWHGINGAALPNATGGMTYHADRLYYEGHILCSKTGRVLCGGKGEAAATPYWERMHLLLVSSNHVYGFSLPPGWKDFETQPRTALCQVFTLDGRLVAQNQMSAAVPEGIKLEQIMTQTRSLDGWWFSLAYPMTISGDRLFVRSLDHLWCIGATTREEP